MSIHHLNVEFVKKVILKLRNVVKLISAVSLITCTIFYLKMIKYDELLCLNANHGFTRYQYSKVVSAHLTHMNGNNCHHPKNMGESQIDADGIIF